MRVSAQCAAGELDLSLVKVFDMEFVQITFPWTFDIRPILVVSCLSSAETIALSIRVAKEYRCFTHDAEGII